MAIKIDYTQDVRAVPFKSRTPNYPRTYFLYSKGNEYYLLFWIEHGKDNSIYIWFDDSPKNDWQVKSTYHKDFPILSVGPQEIAMNTGSYHVYDPHVSWHKSGNIHVSGYDKEGKRGAHLISDRGAESLVRIEQGKTVPFCQLVFPIRTVKKSMRLFSRGLSSEVLEKCCVATLVNGSIPVKNQNSPGESFFIIDSSVVPSGKLFAADIYLFKKDSLPLPPFVPPDEMLYQENFFLYKEYSPISVGIRLLSVNNVKRGVEEIRAITVACFNLNSRDMFQLMKVH